MVEVEKLNRAPSRDGTLVILINDDTILRRLLGSVGTRGGLIALRVEVLEIVHLRQVNRIGLEEIVVCPRRRLRGSPASSHWTRRGARRSRHPTHRQRARVTEADLGGVVSRDVVREGHAELVLSHASRHWSAETSSMAARCFVMHTSFRRHPRDTSRAP